MGRIKLRAIYKAAVNDGKLSDADSRDAKTVVDEKYKFFKPIDPCPAITVGTDCVNTNGCKWDGTSSPGVCSKATGDGC